MSKRSTGVATKYLATQSLLTAITLGAAIAAGVLYPGSPVAAPVVLVVGLALGYGWRDAVGEWRSQRALNRLRAAQAEAINQLKAQSQKGMVDPNQVNQLRQVLLGAQTARQATTAAPEQQQEETT